MSLQGGETGSCWGDRVLRWRGADTSARRGCGVPGKIACPVHAALRPVTGTHCPHMCVGGGYSSPCASSQAGHTGTAGRAAAGAASSGSPSRAKSPREHTAWSQHPGMQGRHEHRLQRTNVGNVSLPRQGASVSPQEIHTITEAQNIVPREKYSLWKCPYQNTKHGARIYYSELGLVNYVPSCNHLNRTIHAMLWKNV